MSWEYVTVSSWPPPWHCTCNNRRWRTCHFFLQIFMLLWLQGRTVRGTPRVAIVLTSPPSLRTHLQSLVTTDYWWVVQSQEWLTNIKILLTISIHHHTTRLWELLTWQPKGKCFDFFCQILPTNFFRKKDGDQTWEFRITIRFWETDHLPLPWAKCCLRGGVGEFVNIRDERGNDGFNRNVVMSAFFLFCDWENKNRNNRPDNVSGNPDIYLFIFSFLSSCIFTNNKLGNFVKLVIFLAV